MKSLLSRTALFIVAGALVMGAAGCSKKPKNLTPLPAEQSGSAAPTDDIPLGNATTGTPPGGRMGQNGDVGATDLNNGGLGTNPSGLNEGLDARSGLEDRNVFASDTVYFEYDKSNVTSQYAANISKVADYLKSHPGDSLLIEGHCDDRGTEEYNLVLGERRALSVRDKLMSAGISGARITTISFGKEKPASFGTTEEDYAKNRRAIFILLFPPGAVR